MKFDKNEHIKITREENAEHGFTTILAKVEITAQATEWDSQINAHEDPALLLEYNEEGMKEDIVKFFYGDIIEVLTDAQTLIRIGLAQLPEGERSLPLDRKISSILKRITE